MLNVYCPLAEIEKSDQVLSKTVIFSVYFDVYFIVVGEEG